MKGAIGFIGQGWIGKHYADAFEKRGHAVVRYALEEPYVQNKNRIRACAVVFIAVPTPTNPDGFDESIVRSVLPLVGTGCTAVIKSTLMPGTTKRLQAAFPDIHVLHSPEFLRERSAARDAEHPDRNIVGIPQETPDMRALAERVLEILPDAPYSAVMDSTDAELVKYAGNCFLYTKVIFMNLLYDLASALNADFETVRTALIHDPRIGESHTSPVHESGHAKENVSAKRGAGGHCFIKDFEAFRQLYDGATEDTAGSALLAALIRKNNELLRASGKDIDLLEGVYGTGPSAEETAAHASVSSMRA